MNKYRVVLKYFAVVEDVEAENYYDAIDKAHGIGGSLQGDENEECELIEGTEPEYQWEVIPLGDSDELVAYNIAMRLSLTMDEYNCLREDIANLRVREWLETVESKADPCFVKQFRQYFKL